MANSPQHQTFGEHAKHPRRQRENSTNLLEEPNRNRYKVEFTKNQVRTYIVVLSKFYTSTFAQKTLDWFICKLNEHRQLSNERKAVCVEITRSLPSPKQTRGSSV